MAAQRSWLYDRTWRTDLVGTSLQKSMNSLHHHTPTPIRIVGIIPRTRDWEDSKSLWCEWLSVWRANRAPYTEKELECAWQEALKSESDTARPSRLGRRD